MVDQTDLQRYLRLEGCATMRDIGGYETLAGRRTRWKVIVRSDNLDKLPPASQQAVIDYGVTTVIDLREREEIERQPDVFATSDVVKYLHLPMKGSPEIVSGALEFDTREDLYLYYLEHCTPQIRAVLEAIAGVERGCTLVHCVAGKDRTGIVAALLLALAKVPPKTIAHDYGITSLYLAEKVQRWREKLIEARADVTRFDREVACPPESMQIVLAEIERRHGGAASYMRTIGLPEPSIDRLRARLVE
jgi:protein-tyrosine phosphatase